MAPLPISYAAGRSRPTQRMGWPKLSMRGSTPKCLRSESAQPNCRGRERGFCPSAANKAENDELRKRLTSPIDQKNLDQLIQIVNDATDHNEKVAALIINIQTLGSTIVKILSNVR